MKVTAGNASATTCCRFCGAPLQDRFVDLGMSPLCESFLKADELNRGETFYPLNVWVCRECKLVQLEEYVSPGEIFDDYAYFSSFSDSWLRHASRYCEMATERFGLDASSFVVELASNDGYLLRNFVEAGVPCLGIEPSHTVADAAKEAGIDTVVRFFGRELATELAAERGRPDLLLGNNVLAHVPDINDFVGGMKILLAETGVITMEFPHLLRMMDENQFDTIYHEHFSYLSLLTTSAIFRHHGLEVFDVEELPSHGGSLRVFTQHEGGPRAIEPAVEALIAEEKERGLDSLEGYAGFTPRVEKTKRDLLRYLIQAREEGKRVVAYGAPGKGNTLLNYCGIRSDLIEYAVDRNPYKHGRFTPGTHIPIHPPEKLDEDRPDVIVILPWNLQKEITKQLAHACDWGAKFVVPIPELEVID
ncbi:MAG: class I SAM-dependent methyltransferase [Planctomycetota bacterium]